MVNDKHTITVVFGTVVPVVGSPLKIAGFLCGSCENTFFLRIEQENRPSYCPCCGIRIDDIYDVYLQQDGSMTKADEDLS